MVASDELNIRRQHTTSTTKAELHGSGGAICKTTISSNALAVIAEAAPAIWASGVHEGGAVTGAFNPQCMTVVSIVCTEPLAAGVLEACCPSS